MKEIIEVKPQGCCGGVLKAIETARKARQDYPNVPVTILGNLVHNTYVKKALEKEGISTIEHKGMSRLQLLDELDEGVVIFTAHGVSPAVHEKAKTKGLIVVDASCPFVLMTQKIVQEKIQNGYEIFYIGKNQHPEAESIYTLSRQVHLIEKKEDIPAGLHEPIFVTNQTTMSVYEISDLFDEIRASYPQAEFHNELCNATRIRQQAILELDPEHVDTLIVVGDPSSNNTRKLESIGIQRGIKQTFRIESALDLDKIDLSKSRVIAVTSGASTPRYLTQSILQTLQGEKAEEIDLAKILTMQK
jgi:4-hydroxy-3-methylbut-2-enyl diphosphate reductase